MIRISICFTRQTDCMQSTFLYIFCSVSGLVPVWCLHFSSPPMCSAYGTTCKAAVTTHRHCGAAAVHVVIESVWNRSRSANTARVVMVWSMPSRTNGSPVVTQARSSSTTINSMQLQLRVSFGSAGVSDHTEQSISIWPRRPGRRLRHYSDHAIWTLHAQSFSPAHLPLAIPLF